MKVSETDAVVMLATLRDGTPGTGEALTCGLCRRFKTEFLLSPGLIRRLKKPLDQRTITCTNSDLPCLMALKAKPVLDALKEVSRR